MSPSVWREWIEMLFLASIRKRVSSPSVWREWIEMDISFPDTPLAHVSLRVEGVD